MYSIDTHGVWLGPAADDLTEGQRERFAAEWDEIDARYPDPDDSDERLAALAACVQYLLGETDVYQAGFEREAAQREAARAYAASRQVARMAALDGASEVQAARSASIDRMTLRKDLGKRPR